MSKRTALIIITSWITLAVNTTSSACEFCRAKGGGGAATASPQQAAPSAATGAGSNSAETGGSVPIKGKLSTLGKLDNDYLNNVGKTEGVVEQQDERNTFNFRPVNAYQSGSSSGSDE